MIDRSIDRSIVGVPRSSKYDNATTNSLTGYLQGDTGANYQSGVRDKSSSSKRRDEGDGAAKLNYLAYGSEFFGDARYTT